MILRKRHALFFILALFIERRAFANEACWLAPLNAAPEKAFNPEDLKKLTHAGEVPNVLGPLKDHWALGFRSESPQDHDYRVVAYAPEAQAIVAYTGCSTVKDGQPVPYPDKLYPDCEQIEVMKFVEPDEKIELYAYNLPGKGQDLSKHPVKVTGPNDGKCTACHGANPNAKWEPYNTWPGFFGSRSRDGEDIMRVGSKEHSLYHDFLKKVFKDKASEEEFARYTKLTWRRDQPTKPTEITPERLKYYLDKGEIPERIQHSSTTQPNPELNKMLSVWRGRMILKTLVKSPEYPQVKNALMAINFGCTTVLPETTIASYLPPALSHRSYGELKKKIDASLAKEQGTVFDEVNRDNPFDNKGRYMLVGSSPNGRAQEQVNQFAYVWQAVGQSFDTWNTADHQRFNFNEGRSATGPLMKAFLDYNAKCDPEMKDYGSKLDYELFSGITPKEDLKPEDLKAICTGLASQGKKSGIDRTLTQSTEPHGIEITDSKEKPRAETEPMH